MKKFIYTFILISIFSCSSVIQEYKEENIKDELINSSHSECGCVDGEHNH
ncbi:MULTISPECIES: hypothetical protein [Streptobacillus]|uniref:Lipoprotein n=1 Tax=Streptobacillus moniliformis (strain ATCC 14647 / DSM 12112 / NCTC 10651 / 9901) TaxID=519441 RepID=D1AW00_STRM9|nr:MULTISPECIES: hypothetical protein [Streptobacillus]ACZ01910.1 hypothetical protein Smon_1477 [Streptobacillus moniliformis DSM 12112]QXW65251.1 hypothetical protein KX935_05395 [Streptobacillus moniliformis]SQA12884.1 Uncharacterised protein [Streptobacillus moniliformis]